MMSQKSNADYWARRQAEDMYKYMEEAEKAADEIAGVYKKSSWYLRDQIDKIFEKYQTKYGLSEKEARELLEGLKDKASLAELLEKLNAGETRQDRADLLKNLEAPAYQARIERCKQLLDQIDIIMTSVYQQEKIKNTSLYRELAKEAYYKGIFRVQQRTEIGFGFHTVDPKVIDRVLNSRWSGKNYSERIWKNTQELAKDLKEELLVSLLTGRTNRETASAILKKHAVGASAARRLVRTESNFVATELNFEAYKACGVEKYQFVAILDLRTSEVCRNLDMEVFDLIERKTGVNSPPMHPWCRSTTLTVVDEAGTEKLARKARNPVTGEVIKIPRKMNYSEWYDTYVKGRPEAELAERQIKNRSSDRKQYAEYRKILKDDIPDKLDNFQDMKYNDSEAWKYTKLAYARQKKLIDHPRMKLPNAEQAVLPEEKFTKYLFDGSHEKGLAKGKAFTSRLGYSINNWKELQSVIKQNAGKYPAVYKDNNGYGNRYEQKMILYGKNGKPANVVVGWLCKADGSVSMSSAYIKEVK